MSNGGHKFTLDIFTGLRLGHKMPHSCHFTIALLQRSTCRCKRVQSRDRLAATQTRFCVSACFRASRGLEFLFVVSQIHHRIKHPNSNISSYKAEEFKQIFGVWSSELLCVNVPATITQRNKPQRHHACLKRNHVCFSKSHGRDLRPAISREFFKTIERK